MKIRLWILVVAALSIPLVASADCTWTSPAGTSIMYTTSPCTNVGVNQTTALWPLDVNGTIGVKGSPALIRPTSWADTDGLKFMGTLLALGQINSRAYNYTGSAIAFIGGFYDGSELLRLASSSNNGLISVTQSSVDSLNADFKNTLLHVVKSAPAALGPEVKLENTGGQMGDAEGVTFASNGFPRAQIRSTVESFSPFNGTLEFHTGFYQSMVERMRITGDGKVGIGTPNPLDSLHVQSVNPAGVRIETTDNTTSGNVAYLGANGTIGPFLASHTAANNAATGAYTSHRLRFGANAFYLDYSATNTVGTARIWTNRLTIDSNGNATFSGTVTGANIQANYQDVAEWVPASEAMTAGTVVVIDPAAINGVKPSSRSYDTGVAGVVSAQPGVLLGQAGDTKEKIATTGRVKVRVDASRGPIAAGDLLVTSDKTGVAMRSDPVDVAGIKMHRPGTLIGKALEPLKDGTGEILVLLSLQ